MSPVVLRKSLQQHTPALLHLPFEERYRMLSKLGDGSFGTVVAAKPTSTVCKEVDTSLTTNTVVAVKILKRRNFTLGDVKKMKEFQFITEIPPHPALVSTFEMVLDVSKHKFHIVMEKMDMSLIQLMDTRAKRPFSIENMKLILYQILVGLNHIHANGFFHRDIKPENILVIKVPVPPRVLFQSSEDNNQELLDSSYSSELNRRSAFLGKSVSMPATGTVNGLAIMTKDFSSYIVKLTDFGLARKTDSKDPYTSYVSTRWYRAPEILLRSSNYGSPVDIWALGAMAVELSTFKALFPGKNEADQVVLLLHGLGIPSSKSLGGKWPAFKMLTKKLNFQTSQSFTPTRVSVSPYHSGLESIVDDCLRWDPMARHSADQLISSPFFSKCEQAVHSLFLMRFPLLFYDNSSESIVKPNFGLQYSQGEDSVRLGINQIGTAEPETESKAATNPRSKQLRRSFPLSMENSKLALHGYPRFHINSGVKKQKGNYPQLSVALSSSPLKMPAVLSGKPEWQIQHRHLGDRAESSGIYQFCDHSIGVSVKEFSPISFPENGEVSMGSESISQRKSSATVPSDLDDFIEGSLKCSTSESFYTAKTTFSQVETSMVQPSQLDVSKLSKLDGALKQVDNLINILTTPVSPRTPVKNMEIILSNSLATQDGETHFDEGRLCMYSQNGDANLKVGIPMDEYDAGGCDIALKKLTKLLDSPGY